MRLIDPAGRRNQTASKRLVRYAWVKFGIALVLAGVMLAHSAVHAAAKVTERTKQKRAAEIERAGLQQKLAALRQEINQTESAKDKAIEALAQSEQAISDANRTLRDLTEEQVQTQIKLDRLTEEQTRLMRAIDAQQKRLAKMLREQYISGNEDRIKLLLSGDDPNRINRQLRYMGYVSKAEAALIEGLRVDLQKVEINKAEVENARSELEEIAQEQREQKRVLEEENTRRTALLEQLSSKLAAQHNEAGVLQRDEQRLSSLVNRLAVLIEEQRKAEAAAEKRRQQQLQQARLKAERERQRAAQQARNHPPKRTAKNGAFRPDPIDADEPPRKSAAVIEPIPEPNAQAQGVAQPFSALRGQLRLPVRGELAARFGSKRSDGPNWKGLFIRAAEGAEVKAVASGRVIFAEWLRGFGNLIIVDHGNQYMTIYGNNQSVLKRPGDVVKSGDVIASAGNSGGNEQSGLYFEIRHHGRAFDPLEWVTIR